MEKFKFLNEHVRVLNTEKPIDMNDRKSEYYAIQYELPDNFSEKAKRHFYDYYDDTAFIFESKVFKIPSSFKCCVHWENSLVS